MSRHRSPSASTLFIVGNTRVFCVSPDRIAFYALTNDSAYIASENPVNLRKWR